MRVIVCGAGQVGSTIARHLATEGMDVTVVDISPDQARRADESYDVRGIVGHASHPEVLERAGARDADMLIAVTRSDEVNMVACQVAYSLFNVRRRIARLRHPGYLEPIWQGLYASDQLPIDVIISPEIEVANGIARRLKTPGALALADGRVRLLGVHCNSTACTLFGRKVRDLSSLGGPPMVIAAIVRNGRAFVPRGDDQTEEETMFTSLRRAVMWIA
jgi:trk system potassium uptake protein